MWLPRVLALLVRLCGVLLAALVRLGSVFLVRALPVRLLLLEFPVLRVVLEAVAQWPSFLLLRWEGAGPYALVAVVGGSSEYSSSPLPSSTTGRYRNWTRSLSRPQSCYRQTPRRSYHGRPASYRARAGRFWWLGRYSWGRGPGVLRRYAFRRSSRSPCSHCAHSTSLRVTRLRNSRSSSCESRAPSRP